MELVRVFSVSLCALALTLGACGDAKNAEGGGPQGKRIDISRYPTVNNSPYGVWLLSDTEQNGIRVTASLFFNSDEAAISVTCSLGNDSITAAAVGHASAPMTNSGNITIDDDMQDMEKGALGGQEFSCAARMKKGTIQYNLNGDLMNAIANGQSYHLTRIR